MGSGGPGEQRLSFDLRVCLDEGGVFSFQSLNIVLSGENILILRSKVWHEIIDWVASFVGCCRPGQKGFSFYGAVDLSEGWEFYLQISNILLSSSNILIRAIVRNWVVDVMVWLLVFMLVLGATSGVADWVALESHSFSCAVGSH